MKNNFIYKSGIAKGKLKFYLFICTVFFAISTLTACNSNSNHGHTTANHDTSSTVTNRVDTEANSTGTKQP